MLELALDTLNATSVALVRDGEAIARAAGGCAPPRQAGGDELAFANRATK